MLDIAAAELAHQPLELGHIEALRRAYVAMAGAPSWRPAGELSADRLLQILRITVSSATLRQAAVEFRASAVDKAVAERMGTSVDDRRVQAVRRGMGRTADDRAEGTGDMHPDAAGVSVDDVVAAFEDTYAEFAGEIAGLGQPV